MSGFLGGGIGPVALKRRQAASSNGLLNNLIAYWPLNEVGGANNALDLHTNALHLTQNSSPGANTGKVYATARTFDGSTQYFSRASEAALQTGDVDFTIAAWLYAEGAANADDVIISQYGATSTQAAFLLQTFTGGNYQFYIVSASDTSVVNSAINSRFANTWQLLIAWHDATNDKIWISVDSATPVAADHTTGSRVSTTATSIGAYANNAYSANAFPGRIGPVAIWKSAPGGGGVLTAAQRAALWNGGAGLAYASFTA